MPQKKKKKHGPRPGDTRSRKLLAGFGGFGGARAYPEHDGEGESDDESAGEVDGEGEGNGEGEFQSDGKNKFESAAEEEGDGEDKGAFKPGAPVMLQGYKKTELNGCFGKILHWDKNTQRGTVAVQFRKEPVKVKPENLEAAPEPLEAHGRKWTSASLQQCYAFIHFSRRFDLPVPSVVDFLRQPCRGLAVMGHTGSRGGHPLSCIVRWFYFNPQMRSSLEIDGRGPQRGVFAALRELFQRLDTCTEDQVVSVDALAAALVAVPAWEDKMREQVYQPTDWTTLYLELGALFEEGGWDHLKRSMICPLHKTTKYPCCGAISTDSSDMLIVIPENGKPLQTSLYEMLNTREEPLFDRDTPGSRGFRCEHCGHARTKTLIHEGKLRHAHPALLVQYNRNPPLWHNIPCGEFPQTLRLSLPETFLEPAESVELEYELAAIQLFKGWLPSSSSKELKDLAGRDGKGYNIIVRSGNTFYWYRQSAVGHPVTGHRVGTPWGGADLDALPVEISWADIQRLRSAVHAVLYNRVRPPCAG